MSDAKDMRQTLVQQRAWVQHWIDDIKAGLKPTPASLETAMTELNRALSPVSTNGGE